MIEESIGLFDVALSFAADAVDSALALQNFADFFGVRCYHYQQYLVRQSGFHVRDVMRHVYSTAGHIVIFNSQLYGRSTSTRFELEIIENTVRRAPVIIIELGGSDLNIGAREIMRFEGVSDETAIQIMSTVAKRGAL